MSFLSIFFTFFVRFLGILEPWRRACGGSDGKNAIFKTPLHGSFINAYVCGDFCGEFFGRAISAFKCEKEASRDDFFAIFFRNFVPFSKN